MNHAKKIKKLCPLCKGLQIMQILPTNLMKYAKKSSWRFVCFSALGAYLRGVFSSTPYINKEVNHHAATMQRPLVILMAICSGGYGCEVAASMKKSPGLKIGGGFPVDVLRWSQVIEFQPGAGMKIPAGSFEIAKGGF